MKIDRAVGSFPPQIVHLTFSVGEMSVGLGFDSENQTRMCVLEQLNLDLGRLHE